MVIGERGELSEYLEMEEVEEGEEDTFGGEVGEGTSLEHELLGERERVQLV